MIYGFKNDNTQQYRPRKRMRKLGTDWGKQNIEVISNIPRKK